MEWDLFLQKNHQMPILSTNQQCQRIAVFHESNIQNETTDVTHQQPKRTSTHQLHKISI